MELAAIWFFLWGLLWAVFFITDGFDLGIGTLLPFLGKDNATRREMLATMGPLWDGNEVWLITAGGVTFAAFPRVYATMFSALYIPLMLILFGLILRGVALEFRHHHDSDRWRKLCDTCVFLGSFLPAFLFGVAFANIFKGIPIDGEGIFQGSWLRLVNPYGVVGGILFVLLFLLHGAAWLAIRTEGDLEAKAWKTFETLWPAALSALLVFVALSWGMTGLFVNYIASPVLFLVPLVPVAGILLARLAAKARRAWSTWAASALTIVGATFFGIIGIFPNLFPSSIRPEFSLSIHNAASSPLTLKIILGVALVFLPVVLAYQVWAYNLFRRKLTPDDVRY
jgi:cytochrome d ubiquinol oxidase subunit II